MRIVRLDAQVLQQQREEVEEAEAQVDACVPVVRMLWRKYLGYDEDGLSAFQIATWLGRGDLHAIRWAIIEVGGIHANDEQSEDIEYLVGEIEDRIMSAMNGSDDA